MRRFREFLTPSGYRQSYCHPCWNAYHVERWKKNDVAREARNKKTKERDRAERLEVIRAYGSKCECCGESRPEFLALDHRNGDGAEERHRLHIASKGTLRLAKREGFPNRYRLLCHNCNQARAFYGYCPHTRPKEIG